MEYSIKVIDGFEIKKTVSEGTKRNNKIFDITIVFQKEGKFFTEASYRRVLSIAVAQIERKLKDLTGYNKTVKQECEAIALPTLVFLVEDILLRYKI